MHMIPPHLIHPHLIHPHWIPAHLTSQHLTSRHLTSPHPIHQLGAFFDKEAPRLIALSEALGTRVAPGCRHKAAARAHSASLVRAGFTVRSEAAGTPAAFCAEAGNDGPVIGLLGSGSAAAGRSPHLIGIAAHLAALAVQHHMQLHQLPGRVRFYGGASDEGRSDMTAMARGGAFDDVDAVLAWHPASHTGVVDQTTLATIQSRFLFKGNVTHPAGSARDAVELMNVGVNYLREFMTPDARVHYTVLDSGSLSHRAVQARAEVAYVVRCATNDQASDLYRRVTDVARGAALMTGCALEIRFDSSCASLQRNGTLNQILYEEMRGIESLEWGRGAAGQTADDAETGYAAPHAYRDNTADDIAYDVAEDSAADTSRTLGAVLREQAPPVYEGIRTYDPLREDVPTGSSDVADVSWATPTVQAQVACYAFGTPVHAVQSCLQDTSRMAHAGMLRAARILASTAIRLLQQPQALADARAELLERRGGRPYSEPTRDQPLPIACRR